MPFPPLALIIESIISPRALFSRARMPLTPAMSMPPEIPPERVIGLRRCLGRH